MKRFIFSAFLFFMVFMATAAVFAQGSSAPEMALPAMVVAVLNFFAPLAIQFLKVKMESRLARFWTALLISGLTGVIAAVVAKVDLNNTIELVRFLSPWRNWHTIHSGKCCGKIIFQSGDE